MRTRNELTALLNFLAIESLQTGKTIYLEDLNVSVLAFQSPPNTFVLLSTLIDDDVISGFGFAECQKEDKFRGWVGLILATKKAVDNAVNHYFGDKSNASWGGVAKDAILGHLKRVQAERANE